MTLEDSGLLKKSDELRLKAKYAQAFESFYSFLDSITNEQRVILETTKPDHFWVQQISEWTPEEMQSYIELVDLEKDDHIQVASFWRVLQGKIDNLKLNSTD